MNVKQLKEKLRDHPDNMDVYLLSTSQFGVGLANNVYVENIKFSEEPDSKPLCNDNVLIIEDI